MYVELPKSGNASRSRVYLYLIPIVSIFYFVPAIQVPRLPDLNLRPSIFSRLIVIIIFESLEQTISQ
jgi:hypothetical protein